MLHSRNLWPKAAASLVSTALLIAAIAHASAAAARSIKLVAFGDSITAGLGLKPAETYVEHLQSALRAKGLDVDIVNAGVSGDTAGDGLERVDWSVPDGTDGVILALGANDMLRGIDPSNTAQSLERIIAKLQAHRVEVLLVGMLATTNLGSAYRAAFDRIFPDLAARHGVDLYPFLLQGVALVPDLNQDDGLHPNAKGAAIIADNMLASVLRLAQRIAKR